MKSLARTLFTAIGAVIDNPAFWLWQIWTLVAVATMYEGWDASACVILAFQTLFFVIDFRAWHAKLNPKSVATSEKTNS